MHIRLHGDDCVLEASASVDGAALGAALGFAVETRGPVRGDRLRRGDEVAADAAGDGTSDVRLCRGLWGRRPDEQGRLVVQRSQPPAVSAASPYGPVPVVVDGEPGPPVAIPWAAIVPSVIAGGVMALIFSPFMAIMAGVSAAAMVGRSLVSRVRCRRQRARRITQLEQFEHAKEAIIVAWQQAEVGRRRAGEQGPERLFSTLADGSINPWTTRDVTTLQFAAGRIDDQVDVDSADGGDPTSVCLVDVPLSVEISAGRGLALCGDREPQLRLARWAVCSQSAAVGPADLNLLFLVAPDRLVDWDWAKWLPSRPMVATNHDEVEAALANPGPADCSLVVVDGLEPVASGEFGSMLSGRLDPCRLVWLGANREVPAGCSTVLTQFPDRSISVECFGDVARAGRGHGLSADEARAVALALAPLDDPELAASGSDLPTSVMLGDLVGVASAGDWGDATERRWSCSQRRRLDVAVGRDGAGPFVVDLVEDGPHMLVAGTTGAGKSEFLRTLVAGLAVSHPPEHVNFVLIDFKGGGAFDVVGDLPHVAAVVTDLDPAESERALRSLRAELHSREELLRSNEASSIDELADDVPLARLVVVVDEFAALADELPSFLDGLVDIARRGRSLGVHLVLATQRPAGVVTGQIRANTALRVCLRVQEKADSSDVIDVATGAMLPPVPGRALIRRQGSIREVQVARIGHAEGGVTIRPFVIHPLLLTDDALAGEQTDLRIDALIEATRRRFGAGPVTSPWAPPLAVNPDWRAAALALGADNEAVRSIGLGWLDDPDHRCHRPLGWQPDRSGLLVVGADVARVGQTTVLAVIGHALAEPETPIFVIDGGGAQLDALAMLPTIGDVVEAQDVERTARLILQMADPKRSVARGLIVLHRYAMIVDLLAEQLGPEAPNIVQRLIRDGAVRGLRFIVTAGSDREVSMRVSSMFGQRVVHALADPTGYLTFGIKPADAVGLGPNDVIHPETGLRGRVGWLNDDELTALAKTLPINADAVPVRVLGEQVARETLPTAAAGPNGWIVPIGLDEDLAARSVVVAAGRPLVFVGQPESGRSTALATATASIDPTSVCVIDDADQLSKDEGEARLAAAAEQGRPVVLATTPASLRSFGGWIVPLLASATVVLINPSRHDGEAVRTLVPDLSAHPVGRSVVIDRGRAVIIQLAA